MVEAIDGHRGRRWWRSATGATRRRGRRTRTRRPSRLRRSRASCSKRPILDFATRMGDGLQHSSAWLFARCAASFANMACRFDARPADARGLRLLAQRLRIAPDARESTRNAGDLSVPQHASSKSRNIGQDARRTAEGHREASREGARRSPSCARRSRRSRRRCAVTTAACARGASGGRCRRRLVGDRSRNTRRGRSTCCPADS